MLILIYLIFILNLIMASDSMAQWNNLSSLNLKIPGSNLSDVLSQALGSALLQDFR